MPLETVIRLDGVGKRFGDGAAALEAISLDIAPGTFAVLVGASGSGKTTLLRLINRLIEPTTGTVSIKGEDVAALDPVVLRRRIGYVFQETGLFPHMTVAENIAITPKLMGWDEAARARRVTELLDLVRLPQEFATRLPAELSGGQRQRVGVARALGASPGIMLMDEPFAALDPLTREGLGEDYRALHDQLGLTTVMITHDMLEALSWADRVVVLSRGRIVAQGPPSAMIDNTDADVAELIAAPRRHATRIGRLFATASPGAGGAG